MQCVSLLSPSVEEAEDCPEGHESVCCESLYLGGGRAGNANVNKYAIKNGIAVCEWVSFRNRLAVFCALQVVNIELQVMRRRRRAEGPRAVNSYPKIV